MSIMYAVVSYDANAGRALNIVGWSRDEAQARGLESQMNDIAEFFTGDESETSLVEYCTEPISLYGATAEHQAYGDFDALIRNGIFHAIVPADQGEHYLYLREGTAVVHCTNVLKGLEGAKDIHVY